MSTRVKQVMIVAAGAVLALIMVFLGLWQMQVFVDKGDRSVQARAEQAPVPLLSFVAPDGTVGDVYGKRVTVTGRYLPHRQLTIPAEGGPTRVLTAFQVADGRVVPIVRGATGDPHGVAPATTEMRTETGLFLPGEGDADAQVGADQLGSVRMPLLAQRWPERLVPGFVTLDEAGSAVQGLDHAQVTLPHGDGSFQNGGYALQWWIFAAFGFGMCLKFAHALGQRDRADREAAASRELAGSAGSGTPRNLDRAPDAPVRSDPPESPDPDASAGRTAATSPANPRAS